MSRNKLNDYQKEIFDRWVKVVDPNIDSIRIGIKSIINKADKNRYSCADKGLLTHKKIAATMN